MRMETAMTAPTTRRQRHKIPSRIRFIVMRRDGYACQMCGVTARQGYLLEIDHRLSRARGGSDDVDNLWVLCSLCNNGKGAEEL